MSRVADALSVLQLHNFVLAPQIQEDVMQHLSLEHSTANIVE